CGRDLHAQYCPAQTTRSVLVLTRPSGGGMTARQQAIFTLDELAAYLKVGKRTLYRLASHGEIPAFKVGGTWRFRQSEIDRWINDQIQAGRKKEVIRTDEQPSSAEHSVSSGRAVRRRRQTE
ncbi:helix-turn-helix domain-containing protein, partial [Hydrogenophaga sp.]|uniref:helix-turn-helix domain-containing protein n=1 Tax=Hydrogenophaga sp. TaxID=1904254 RepID=UPI003F70D2F7